MLSKTVSLIAAIGCLVSGVLLAQKAIENVEVTLTPGEKAPSLDTAKLLKGTRIPKFELGKTYFLDFWSTGCGPCVRAMPHLSQLATKYQNRVTFISVNVERVLSDPRLTDIEMVKQVEKFVKRRSDVLNYTVLMDNDAQTLRASWLKASGQDFVPVGYVVADGKVVWTANGDKAAKPPLDEVLAGTYVTPGIEFKQQQIDAATDMENMRRVRSSPALEKAFETNDHAAVVRILEEVIANNPRLSSYFSLELFAAMLHVNRERAYRFADNLLEKTTDPIARGSYLLLLSRFVVSLGPDMSPADADLALRWVQESTKLFPEQRFDHYAVIAQASFAKEDHAKAVEMMEKAIATLKRSSAALGESQLSPDKQQILDGYESLLAKYRAERATRGASEASGT